MFRTSITVDDYARNIFQRIEFTTHDLN